MSNQTSDPPQPHREWAQRQQLLQSVLRYLAVNGPTNWVTLYLHFDKAGTGEIGKALGHLAMSKHITVVDNVAKITASGADQLKSGK